jgi:hypothetical protein
MENGCKYQFCMGHAEKVKLLQLSATAYILILYDLSVLMKAS